MLPHIRISTFTKITALSLIASEMLCFQPTALALLTKCFPQTAQPIHNLKCEDFIYDS